MSVVLSILLWILASLGLLLLSLLVIPFQGRAQGAVSGFSANGQAAIRWAFGLVQFKASSQAGLGLYLFGLRILRIRPGQQAAKPRPKKKKSRKKRGGVKSLLGNRRTLFSAAVRIARTFRLQGRVAGRVGFDDPADTAALFGLLQIGNDRIPGLALDIDCDFTEEVLDLNGQLRLRLWIIHLGVVLLALILNRETRQALRAVS